MEENFKVGIPYPPDDIFKFRKNIRQPAMKQLEEPNVSYLPEDIKYLDGEGIFVHYKGVPFPTKGHVFPEAIYAVNQVKRIFSNSLRVIANRDMIFPLIGFLFTNKTKVLNRMVNGLIDTVDLYILKPYYLDDGYYASASKEIRAFVREMLKELKVDQADLFAEIVSMMFQYDNAYYFRFIDIMSETWKDRLMNDFVNEVDYLTKLAIERDYQFTGMKPKYEQINRMAKFMWYIPSFRRAIRKGLEAVNFEKWQMDEADKYHSLLMGDYNYQGKDLESRIKEYIDYHGGENKLPPRVAYMPAENI